MKILNVIPYWGLEFGGQFVNVANIAANLMLKGHEIFVLTTSRRPEDFAKTYPWIIGGDRLALPIHASKSYERVTRFSYEFKKKFESCVREYDITLIHGLWRFPTSFAAFFCRRHKLPYIVFTHAMMSPWSLSHKKTIKEAYFRLFEKKNLDRANALIVMDKSEIETAEKKGLATEKFCFQNALNREEIISAQEKREMKKQAPRDTVTILYLSRIHPKKGLIFLVRAFASLVKTRHKLKLIIAGPAEDVRYMKKVRDMIKNKHLKQHISVVGTAAGQEKEKVFTEADIFVLPSADDSKPLAVLEAMAYGLPVITTRGCKMPEIDGKMGYVVKRKAQEIARTILELTKNESLREKMGSTGHRYVLDNFTWDKRINELLEIIERY